MRLIAYLLTASLFGTPTFNVNVMPSLAAGLTLVVVLLAVYLMQRLNTPASRQISPGERERDENVSTPHELDVRRNSDAVQRHPFASPTLSRDPLPSDRRTVLVVDDNATVIRFVERALSDIYAVCSAQNGREALLTAEAERPDLIISDVMMPEMDGHELCRKVKGDPSLRHIPVVLLTALATQNDRIEGLEVGSDDYIFKPFDTRELRARVRNLIAARDEQRRLAVENDELATACASKTDLLSHAAHDLKNPLGAIRELAEIVKEEVGPDSEAFQPADLIYRSSDQMLHVVSALLESTAMEEGRIALDRRQIDLAAVAADVVRRNDALARRKGQTIELTMPQQDYGVRADERLILEAMDNLISNAIKYSPRNSSIRVRMRREPGRIRFSVSDQGPGLSEKDQGRLFRKFERLSPQPTGGESSTGLGLAIVKQIVTLHDGIVEVRSAPGEGSTFSIELTSDAGEKDASTRAIREYHRPGTPGEHRY